MKLKVKQAEEQVQYTTFYLTGLGRILLELILLLFIKSIYF